MDGILSETLPLYCHKTQEIKYRCCYQKLWPNKCTKTQKNKVQVVWNQKLLSYANPLKHNKIKTCSGTNSCQDLARPRSYKILHKILKYFLPRF